VRAATAVVGRGHADKIAKVPAAQVVATPTQVYPAGAAHTAPGRGIRQTAVMTRLRADAFAAVVGIAEEVAEGVVATAIVRIEAGLLSNGAPPVATRLVVIAGGVAISAVLLVSLGVDALVPTSCVRRIGAAALAVDAGQVAITGTIAAPAVLLVVARIDALPVTKKLIARTPAALTRPIHAGDVRAAGPAAGTAVRGIGLGVNAALAALDRAVLALLRFLLVMAALLLGFDVRAGEPQAERRQQPAEAAAAEGFAKFKRQTIEALAVHRDLLSRASRRASPWTSHMVT
jgi:hypothetical protein